jgi:glucosamine-6-phosphate deaminase
MKIHICDSKLELGRAAADEAAEIIRRAAERRGRAVVVAATGASQFSFLDALVKVLDIDWSAVTFFHLDEYVGLPDTHPASFRRYLKERILEHVQPRVFHFINGDNPDSVDECRRLAGLIGSEQIDVAFVGIGENGHLAFNDPPADFETEEPYLVVELDEACRRQQVGEGWFAGLDEVPLRAISMSIRQIMKAERVLCVVPDKRKAQAVADCFNNPPNPMHPASILQTHAGATLYLDQESASLLRRP